MPLIAGYNLKGEVDIEKKHSPKDPTRIDGLHRILGMVYSIGDYGLITISYTFTKMLFASNDCFSSYEVYAARMIV